ncbi:hypothetical protein BT96DRAFT_959870 [Gymnopus androsaceus JB14]|uniref:Uncharacterized protein n=1 Tax=Gymnopus androsaceus JB14 TaxID=1447944 RepID=A0A6A4GW94_9AGAR|nr:hypothetical protein BT96DRAFT_959870 [Gymnopus androsaceus JB14]
MSQFKELRDLKRWTWTRDERAQALDEVRNAIALQFNAFYGSNVDDLNGWHNLCRALQVQDIPDTVNGCKAIVKEIYVNICDLVDYSLGAQEKPPILHESESDLAEYSRDSDKIYPRENAYAGGLLRFLLRQIFGRYQGNRNNNRGREFPYDPTGETMPQFWKLCDQNGWERDTPERDEPLDGIRNAIALQFNAFYGSNVDDLNGWHNLCRALRVQDLPDTVNGCKAIVKKIHVNICDLVDYSLGKQEELPKLHDSEPELAAYSRSSGKIYPRENAYAGGLLRFLLRQITGKYMGNRNRGRGRGRGRGGRQGRGGRG